MDKMSGTYCRVCFKAVTEGKVCALCFLPVCGDHRTKIGGGWGSESKTYYCRPPCAAASRVSSSASQHQQRPYRQQQQQQQPPRPIPSPYQQQRPPASSTPPAYLQPPQPQPPQYSSPSQRNSTSGGATYLGHSSNVYAGAGGASPVSCGGESMYGGGYQPRGYSDCPLPPQGSPQGFSSSASSQPAHSATSLSLFAVTSPVPPVAGSAAGAHPTSAHNPPPPPLSQGGGASTAASSSPSSAAASTVDLTAARRAFGPNSGDPLPLVPAGEAGTIRVRWANSNPCDVPDDPTAVARLTAPFVPQRTLRPRDAVQYVSVDTQEVRRGVIVGVLNDSLIVLERLRADHGYTAAATCISGPQQLATLAHLPLGKCKHCGCFIPLDESRLHVDRIHRASSGSSTRVDDVNGLCVGNVDLLLGLKRLSKLGEGAQGQVWKCTPPPGVNVDDDVRMEFYVLKEVPCETQDEALARYQQAVRLMSLRHHHVIRYLAVQRTPQHDCVRVVMPYYPDCDLQRTINRASARLGQHWVSSVVLQLATALKHLHSHSPPILHGDLKPQNVLMFSGGNQVILMDFDTSVELGRDALHRNNDSTIEWTAPEALPPDFCSTSSGARRSGGGRCSINSDVWSLGLIAYVLMVLPEFPMLENDRHESLLLNNDAWRADELAGRVRTQCLSRGYSAGLVGLVVDMLSPDPQRRPSAAAVVDRLISIMEQALLSGTD
jgi:hypothetical protein